MDRTSIYRDIDDERDRQEARFGNQVHSWPIWAAILSEETGEVSEACLQPLWREDVALDHLREELVQVAAVAVQMLEKLDSGDYSLVSIENSISRLLLNPGDLFPMPRRRHIEASPCCPSTAGR